MSANDNAESLFRSRISAERDHCNKHGRELDIADCVEAARPVLDGLAARDAEIARLQGVLGILDGIVHVKPEGHIVGAVGDLRDEGDAARKALYELQAVMHTEDRPVRAENRTLRARVAQLEAIAGDALNELRDALDGKPNPKAREFLGLLEDRLDGGAR